MRQAGISLASLVYVVGEVLISLAVIGGGFYLLSQPELDASVKIAVGGFIGAASSHWFSRRQAEHSENALREVANGKLSALLEKQTAMEAAVLAHGQVLAEASRQRPF